MRSLHWFRTDLRLSDNIALLEAITSSTEVLTCFVITPETWKQHDMAAIKVQFILENLKVLSDLLWKHGIPLLIAKVDRFSDCPQLLYTLCQKHNIEALYFNKEYEVDEQKRDATVTTLLSEKNIKIYSYDDQTVFPPNFILSQKKEPFKVFTPFKKTWLIKAIDTYQWKPAAKVTKKFICTVYPDKVPNTLPDFQSTIALHEWPAGEIAAKKRLIQFCSAKLQRYHIDREYPALNGTSKLSPYLAQGVVSPRQCIQAMINQLETDRIDAILDYPGPATWLSELIWREFYKQILFHFPRVSRGKPFQLNTDKIQWQFNEKSFNAWRTGTTGFPIIDAAMRQLNQTGWMHNRLRMLVACFLAKSLLLDWRIGERYFMEHLIDGDLAANNGGWQWSASTGTDAAPYFRIFNPMRQSEKFDPEGEFIRQYCPELESLDARSIHDPYHYAPLLAKGSGYPTPLVDLKKSREYVVSAFKAIKS